MEGWSDAGALEDVLDENNHFIARLSQKRPQSSPSPNIHRPRLAAEDGQYRKALQSLTSSGIAPSSREVLDAMASKHLQSALPTIPAPPLPQPVHVSESDVLRALQSSHTGTAPGPSCFSSKSPEGGRFLLLTT